MDVNFPYDLMMDVRQGEKVPLAFVASIIYLVRVSHHQNFLVSGEVKEEQEKQRPLWLALVLTLVGTVVIGIGGELVVQGAERIVASLGVPELFMGMIVAPAAIELEEIILPNRGERPRSLDLGMKAAPPAGGTNISTFCPL